MCGHFLNQTPLEIPRHCLFKNTLLKTQLTYPAVKPGIEFLEWPLWKIDYIFDFDVFLYFECHIKHCIYISQNDYFALLYF